LSVYGALTCDGSLVHQFFHSLNYWDRSKKMKHIPLALAGLVIGGLSAGAHAATVTGGANHSLMPTIQTNVNVPVNVQVPVNIGGTQQVSLVNNQNTNQANQNTVGNAAGAGSNGTTAMGGANNSTAPTIQTNINAPVNVQVPINVGGNQQATLVNNQNTNQANQNAVGNAAGASGPGASGSFAGNQLWQTQYTPSYIHSFD
jgi:hypothetical protein